MSSLIVSSHKCGGPQVVIREASDVVGGRLSTRTVPVAMKGHGAHGPTVAHFAIEHGE